MRDIVSVLNLVAELAVTEEVMVAGSPCSLTLHTVSANSSTYTPQSYAEREREREILKVTRKKLDLQFSCLGHSTTLKVGCVSAETEKCESHTPSYSY